MSLIDHTYFDLELALGQLTEMRNISSIQKYIDRYEREYLIELMGQELYLEYSNDPTNSKFEVLIHGSSELIDCGCNKVIWDGLANTYCISPIAYYVYYHYQKSINAMSMGVGTMVSVPENAKRLSPQDKLTFAWNRMVDLSITAQCVMKSEGLIDNYCSSCGSSKIFTHINSWNL